MLKVVKLKWWLFATKCFTRAMNAANHAFWLATLLCAVLTATARAWYIHVIKVHTKTVKIQRQLRPRSGIIDRLVQPQSSYETYILSLVLHTSVCLIKAITVSFVHQKFIKKRRRQRGQQMLPLNFDKAFSYTIHILCWKCHKTQLVRSLTAPCAQHINRRYVAASVDRSRPDHKITVGHRSISEQTVIGTDK